MKHVDFELNGKKAHGLEVQLPGAAMVRGVKTVDDLLSATVRKVSTAGSAFGIQEGMAGRDALARLL